MTPYVLPPKDRDGMVAQVARAMRTYMLGKPIRVYFEEAKPDRTPRQNRFLWSVPYEMLKERTGYSKEELHEYFCGEIFGWTTRRGPKTPQNPDGIYSEPVRTTTTNENGERDICSAEDFSALWKLAQQKGAEIGLVIPDPDPAKRTR